MSSITDRAKVNEVLRRSIPITRMVDYGMRFEEAQIVHAKAADSADWVEVLTALVDENEAAATRAEVENDSARASDLWHRGAMGLVFAHMAENFDTPRKITIHRRMIRNFKRFVANSDTSILRLEVSYGTKTMFGWHFRCSVPRAAVVVFGGLSGWATAYRGAADALVNMGVDCLLVDVPGQGETRLESRLYADSSVVSAISRFFDYLDGQSINRVGIWGNSFGGLFAALVAAADKRVAACCINGAPPRCEPPHFRTPSEQMAALFGKLSLDNMTRELATLHFDPKITPIKCPVLILEGGADPLALPGTQDVFMSSNPQSQKLTWHDGEHTLYNHAAERNRLVSKWFARVLAGHD